MLRPLQSLYCWLKTITSFKKKSAEHLSVSIEFFNSKILANFKLFKDKIRCQRKRKLLHKTQQQNGLEWCIHLILTVSHWTKKIRNNSNQCKECWNIAKMERLFSLSFGVVFLIGICSAVDNKNDVSCHNCT